MSSENFVEPTIPCFNGHYDHWSMLMENLLQSKEFWQVVADGVATPSDDVALIEAQQKEYE